MNKEEILYDLIELSKNETPITLSSLMNTFDEVSYLSKCYRDFVEVNGKLYSGFINVKLGNTYLKIRFLPQTAIYTDTECKKEDNVIIIYIHNCMNKKMSFINKKYIRNPFKKE